jgi:hypothetical protein
MYKQKTKVALQEPKESRRRARQQKGSYLTIRLNKIKE